MSLSTPWSIKSRARLCGKTQTPFQSGEVIVSFLFKRDTGEIERLDLSAACAETPEIPGTVLAKWMHTVKLDTEEAKAAEKSVAQSAEALFWTLMEESALGTTLSRDQILLCQLLALWLERKRILKAHGPRKADGQNYLHTATKRTVWVPWVEATTQELILLDRSWQIG